MMMNVAEQPNISERLPGSVRRRCALKWQNRSPRIVRAQMMWPTDSFSGSQQAQFEHAVECWVNSDSGFRSLKRHSLPERQVVASAAISSGEMKNPYRENADEARANSESGLLEQRLVSFG